MDANKRAISLLKKIWEDNDLNAVELFRTMILSEDLCEFQSRSHICPEI